MTASSSLSQRPSGRGLPLFWWLTLAFVGVALVGTMLTAFIAQRRIEGVLNAWQVRRVRESLLRPLAAYYQRRGSWDGLDRWLEAGAPGLSSQQRRMLLRAPWVLTDPEGRPVAGALGRPLPRDWTQDRLPIRVGGEIVGWLWMRPTHMEQFLDAAEQTTLAQVRRSAWMSGFLALAVALAVGLVLALAFTRPVHRLIQAMHRVARGRLGLQVSPPAWNRELYQLTTTFNAMSTALARAEHLRKQMTADLAHDLRTPISVLLGYAESLRDGLVDPDPEVFQVLYRETQYLQRLVDDLRLLFLHDAGRLELQREKVDVADLVEHVAQSFRPRAERQGIQLRVEAEVRPLEARVDAHRIRRALDNLVSNALRYTPEGGRITLRAYADNGHVVLEVEDTGEGIPPEHLPYIFERFYRVDVARSESGKSSGLGLAIVKALVEAHGGRVSVESQVGRGTRFRLTLPREGK